MTIDREFDRECEDKPWVPLARLDEIEIGGARYVERERGALSLVRVSAGEVTLIDDTCPHAGMSLSGGRVDQACIVCPWHAWSFRLSDGRCPDNEAIGVRRYPCRVRAGVVETPHWVMDPGPAP